ncbi:MAG TPA: hypothetical protein ENF57_02915 [Candidatus Korarchaeota archaeon]|nr:hypothetical protein [Candidatus Korarchaeota archaeon]
MDEVEQIGVNWDRFSQRIKEDPYEFLELGPEELRIAVLENLTPLAKFLGVKAIIYECGRWYARIERIELGEEIPDLSEVMDKECYVSLEDENGCDVVVLAIREDETGDVEVFARSAGEILEIMFSGKACENQDVPWDDFPW